MEDELDKEKIIEKILDTPAKLLYKDEAGNTLNIDNDGRVSIRNAEGKIVNPEGIKEFMTNPEAQKVASKEGIYGMKLVSEKEVRGTLSPHSTIKRERSR